MIRHQKLPLILVVIFLFSSIIGEGCSKKPMKAIGPDEKINAILLHAEYYVKEIGLRWAMDTITDVDTLINKILDESAKLKLNSIGTMALTEKCLKNKRGNGANNIEAFRQFENDSIYLSAIELKLREIVKQLTIEEDPTVLDVMIRNEKIKLLMAEMNKICPTDEDWDMFE